MKQYDVQGQIDWAMKNDPHTFLNQFGGDVAKETGKVKISHKLTTRPHTFGDGETGEVAQKLVIEIDFSDAVIQPHNDFEGDFCSRVVDAVQENVNGLFENYEPADTEQ